MEVDYDNDISDKLSVEEEKDKSEKDENPITQDLWETHSQLLSGAQWLVPGSFRIAISHPVVLMTQAENVLEA